MINRHLTIIILAIAGLMILAGCTIEGYETGNGELSFLKTEYADVVVKGGMVMAMVTDEDVVMPVREGTAFDNAKDTIVRAMVHYRVPQDGEKTTLLGMKQVALLAPVMQSADPEPLVTDPVQLVSWWVSTNGMYVNMNLGVKSGTAEEENAVQKLKLVGDGQGQYNLYHDQGGIPMYYTKEVRISVPVVLLKGEEGVVLRINTFDGVKEMRIDKE